MAVVEHVLVHSSIRTLEMYAERPVEMERIWVIYSVMMGIGSVVMDVIRIV